MMAAQEQPTLSRRDLAALHAVGLAAVVAVGVLSIGLIAYRLDTSLWDFRAYYWGTRVWMTGGDPYDQAQLAALSGQEQVLPFHYPPLMLVLFRPLASLPYAPAAYLWIAFKLGMLLLLVRLWRREWLGGLSPFLLAAVVLFAFHGTVLRDLRGGNVAIIEQYLLWSGLALLLAGRRLPAAALVAAGAAFRLTPMLLAVVLLAPGRDDAPPAKRGQAFGLALMVFAALVVLPGLAWPELARSYLGALSGLGGASVSDAETGALSAWSALAWVSEKLGRPGLAPLLGLAWSAAIVGLSVPALLRAWRARDLQRLVMMTVIVYGLCLPMVSSYGLILLIVPSAVLWIDMMRGRVGAEALFAALVCFGAFHVLPVPLPGLLHDRHWLVLTLGAWLVYLFLERRGALGSASPEPEQTDGPR